ncbi:energy transducer TonB [Trinickia sp. NRRL B-1857]|uniref:energy transducer TonB n=1 Tax=Trinickia sp. NRRL B-1857 TaxID=3162879 RepID=UPI003D2C72D3
MAKPEFPLESQKAHESGKTKLMFELSPTGNFEHITVVESSGYQRLDDSAIKSVQASHCLPYYKNGKAVSIGVTSAYDFLPVK